VVFFLGFSAGAAWTGAGAADEEDEDNDSSTFWAASLAFLVVVEALGATSAVGWAAEAAVCFLSFFLEKMLPISSRGM
jgi:hypothetical protein